MVITGLLHDVVEDEDYTLSNIRDEFGDEVAALVSALLITPSGLGAVEFAIVGVLVLVGVDAGVAVGIAILDQAISYWGLMAVGAVVYVVSGRK